MADDAQLHPSHIRTVARLLQVVLETVPIPLTQRPAFPTINSPNAGAVVTASQVTPTPLAVTVTSNRHDESHHVDLLDADSFAVLDTQPVSFTATPSATITIPVLTAPGPTTLMLQCRAPANLAGNVHRILIEVQAPVIPPAPTVSLSATDGGGNPLPSGMYDHTTTPGLSAVTVVAATPSGTPPFTYNWSVTRGIDAPVETQTAVDNIPIDLIPAGTVFPTYVFISCYVTDAHSLNSAPDSLSYIIS